MLCPSPCRVPPHLHLPSHLTPPPPPAIYPQFATAGTLPAENEEDTFSDHRETILKTAKALVEDTKTLVAGAASTQEQLASAAQNAVATILQLADVVKLGAASLGTDNTDAQVGDGRGGGGTGARWFEDWCGFRLKKIGILRVLDFACRWWGKEMKNSLFLLCRLPINSWYINFPRSVVNLRPIVSR